jgi:hypothetical protein
MPGPAEITLLRAGLATFAALDRQGKAQFFDNVYRRLLLLSPKWNRRAVRLWYNNNSNDNPYGYRAPDQNGKYAKAIEAGELETIFEKLAGPMSYGEIREMAAKVNIPEGTLRDWRIRALQDRNWRPHLYKNDHLLSLSPQAQSELRTDIVQLARDGEYCPRARVASMARQKWLEQNPQNQGAQVDMPTFSPAWVAYYADKQKLSFKLGHPGRRPAPNDLEVATFIEQAQEIIASRPNKVFNMDETCWRIINGGLLKTACVRGQDNVRIHTVPSPKDGVTAIATISATGEKLPLWVIAKGTTDVCEHKYRTAPELQTAIRNRELEIVHSASGWTSQEIAIKYLGWLSHRVGPPLFLIWDQYSVHRDLLVLRTAREKEIEVLLVPAGQTGQLQPLDLNVFGPLKSMAGARATAALLKANPPKLNKVWAVKTLLECWNNTAEENVQKAFDQFR